ncbi:unnamed protein product [Trichogramma brassicae]|uniref:Uncharacterized protein n=1 Tax=Trichogramma brassicae TaxID=86971 RepID=A0A6H5I997_9HYME|nr:unnamed protein product [Trichogramma brassicae]
MFQMFVFTRRYHSTLSSTTWRQRHHDVCLPRRWSSNQYQPQPQQHQQQLYYPVEEVQIPARAQPQHHHHQIQHHQAAAAAAAAAQQHQHQQQQVVVSHHRQPQPQAQVHQHVQVTPEPITIQHPDEVQQVVRPQPQSLRYHQSIPIQYGYEDEQQVQHQQQSPESIVRAQQSAEQQALAFHKIAQAAHYKHQDDALEQIRVANEKHRQQSALEQIKQGEQVSEAGRQERVQPKDPEGAYKAHLKAQATALVAEHRRAHEAAEYKAHADAILKLQAQQQAHLRAQEEAHRYALNFEKNQARAQAQAQAIANAQALALYNAHKAARAKAQQEAKQAAKAQHDAKKLDPDNAPVVQYLLPNKVPLPAPEEYLPKAAEALRESALQEKRLKQQQKAAAVAQQQHHHQHQHQAQPIKHQQQQIFEIDPNLLRGFPAKLDEQTQELTFLVDADYFRKIQAQQRGEASEQQPARAVLRPASRYQSIEEEPAQRQQHQHQTAHRYQSYHHSGQIDPDNEVVASTIGCNRQLRTYTYKADTGYARRVIIRERNARPAIFSPAKIIFSRKYAAERVNDSAELTNIAAKWLADSMRSKYVLRHWDRAHRATGPLSAEAHCRKKKGKRIYEHIRGLFGRSRSIIRLLHNRRSKRLAELIHQLWPASTKNTSL